MTFGVAAATSAAAIKQGWGSCSSDEGDSIINSTGVVDSGRYLIAILTETMNGSTNGHSYNSWQASATAMARIILPCGEINLPATDTAVSRVTSASATGNVVVVCGWAYDPDRSAASLRVSLHHGRHLAERSTAGTVSRSLNRALHIGGGHLFADRVTVRNGHHDFCTVVSYRSYGSTSSTRHCASVAMNGRAAGAFHGAVDIRGNAVLTRWAWDPDAGASPMSVRVIDNGHILGSYRADRPTSPTDRHPGVSGSHHVTLAPSDGRHRHRVQAINAGSAFSPRLVSLGCFTVLARSDPDGRTQIVTAGNATITVIGWASRPQCPGRRVTCRDHDRWWRADHSSSRPRVDRGELDDTHQRKTRLSRHETAALADTQSRSPN